jgi:gas vesicle protein
MSRSAQEQSHAGTIVFAFVMGALVGAGTAILLAPEAGSRMRKRLVNGARAAQEELTDVAAETREAFGVLTKDARQTLRQTAARLNAALEATREAISGEDEPGVRRIPARASNRKP